MINCEIAREWISLYIDNILDETQKAEFENHINICSNCRQDFVEVKQIIQIVTDNCDEEDLPADFKKKLHNRLLEERHLNEKKGRQSVLHNRYIKIISTIAAGLVMVVLLKDYFAGTLPGTAKLSKTESAGEYNTDSVQARKKASAPDDNGNENADRSALYDMEKANPNVALDITIEGQQKTEKSSTQSEDISREGISQRTDPAEVSGTMDSNDIKTKQSQSVDDPYGNTNTVPEGDGNVQMNNYSIASLYGESLEARGDAAAGDNAKKEIKYTAITIFSAEPQEVSVMVKTYAENYGIIVDIPGNMAFTSVQSMKEAENVGLSLKVPSNEYDEFVRYLKTAVGVSEISLGAMDSVDLESQLDALKGQLNEIEGKINDIKKQRTIDPQALEALYSERDEVQKEISMLTENIGCTNIQLNIIKKE